MIKKSNWIAIFAFLFFLNILALWCVDVSQTAMINQAICSTQKQMGYEVISEGYLTNGLFKADPMVTYHVAIGVNLVSNFLMLLIIIHLIWKD